MTPLNEKMYELLDDTFKALNEKLIALKHQLNVPQMLSIQQRLKTHAQEYRVLLEKDLVDTAMPVILVCQTHIEEIRNAEAADLPDSVENMITFIEERTAEKKDTPALANNSPADEDDARGIGFFDEATWDIEEDEEIFFNEGWGEETPDWDSDDSDWEDIPDEDEGDDDLL